MTISCSKKANASSLNNCPLSLYGIIIIITFTYQYLHSIYFSARTFNIIFPTNQKLCFVLPVSYWCIKSGANALSGFSTP
jgi:hypothetical protein